MDGFYGPPLSLKDVMKRHRIEKKLASCADKAQQNSSKKIMLTLNFITATYL